MEEQMVAVNVASTLISSIDHDCEEEDDGAVFSSEAARDMREREDCGKNVFPSIREYASQSIEPLGQVCHTQLQPHSFFLSRGARTTLQSTSTQPIDPLSTQIATSNALNRVIEITIQDSDDNCDDGNDLRDHEISPEQPVASFFQKRVKTAPNSGEKRSAILGRAGIDPAPLFPRAFQLAPRITSHNHSKSHVTLSWARLQDNQPARTTEIIDLSSDDPVPASKHNIVPMAEMLRHYFSDSNSTHDPSRPPHARPQPHPQTHMYVLQQLIFELDKTLSFMSSKSRSSVVLPLVWVFCNGGSGVGKGFLVEKLAEHANRQLIIIDSTHSVRSSRTFDNLQATLSHDSSSWTADARGTRTSGYAVLFDEVEVTFESSDRGYWSALSSFLASISLLKANPLASALISPPIFFITANCPESSLRQLIRFPPDTTTTIRFFDCSLWLKKDLRAHALQTDFIKRLHRIDSPLRYERFALLSGWNAERQAERFGGNAENIDLEGSVDTQSPCQNQGQDSGINDHSQTLLAEEALRWGTLVKHAHTTSSSSFDRDFQYSEVASFTADLLDRLNSCVPRDPYLSSPLEAPMFATISDVSTHDILKRPDELEGGDTATGIIICRELLERTIYTWAQRLKTARPRHLSSPYHTPQAIHLYLSKLLAKRFFDYSRSLQNPPHWRHELTTHVVTLEIFNQTHQWNGTSRLTGRLKPIYRCLNDEIVTLIGELMK